ncbi:MAG: PepSY domain-containing protein [Actinomycetota bacterium]|nr:PepSY domain-containing protein [Actinomycetota bacterium]
MLKKYPGATIKRIETDSDGVYEAHLVTADGERLTADLDKSFAVTGEEAGGFGGRGHHHGHGGPDADDDDTAAPDGDTQTS